MLVDQKAFESARIPEKIFFLKEQLNLEFKPRNTLETMSFEFEAGIWKLKF